MLSKLWSKAAVTLAAASVTALMSLPALSATPFEQDVANSINAGLAWLKSQNAYAGGYTANAAGLANLALLEKRASGNPSDPPQGYAGANAIDQADLLAGANYMVGVVLNPGYSTYTYQDGNYLAALVEYYQTGGPDPAAGSVLTAINTLVDLLIANQRNAANGYPDCSPTGTEDCGPGLPDGHGGYTPYVAGTDQGYWCYTTGYCRDSSTTQYAALGLAAAQAVYGPGGAHPDPGRYAKINSALTAAATVYALDAGTGSDDGNCGVVDSTERGHGYHSPLLDGYYPSLQQTGSGLFVQALAGKTINDPSVQAYLDWLYNHYRYTDLDNMGNSWPGDSYSYYLWSSFKATEFLISTNTPVNPGNLAPTVLGTQAPDAGPPTGKCSDRQLQRNPAADPQVPLFGSGGAGYYSATAKGQYYDYAYEILGYQCGPGNGYPVGSYYYGMYVCNGLPGAWDYEANQAYMLLVLQRAAGVILPTVTLTASPTSVQVGVKSTLTWASTNANTCTASTGTVGDGWGGAVAVNGSQQVTETTPGLYTYTISCTTGTQTVTATAQVTYTAIPTCDLDGNGVVDSRDIAKFPALIGKHVPPAPKAADANGDGLITVQDERLCVLKCTNANCAISPGT